MNAPRQTEKSQQQQQQQCRQTKAAVRNPTPPRAPPPFALNVQMARDDAAAAAAASRIHGQNVRARPNISATTAVTLRRQSSWKASLNSGMVREYIEPPRISCTPTTPKSRNSPCRWTRNGLGINMHEHCRLAIPDDLL